MYQPFKVQRQNQLQEESWITRTLGWFDFRQKEETFKAEEGITSSEYQYRHKGSLYAEIRKER